MAIDLYERPAPVECDISDDGIDDGRFQYSGLISEVKNANPFRHEEFTDEAVKHALRILWRNGVPYSIIASTIKVNMDAGTFEIIFNSVSKQS